MNVARHLSCSSNDDCLVGFTGFVGRALLGQRAFRGLFNSANIEDLAGQSFSTLVCAAAPATMWIANANPEVDKANLDRIAKSIGKSKAERVVLISTIAVFEDAAGKYTETDAKYEKEKAYGRHRRELEITLGSLTDRLHVIRLPALFGIGLKKNFVFDLINPVPSFLRPDAFEGLSASLGARNELALKAVYHFNSGLGMWELNRELLEITGVRSQLEHEVEELGYAAKYFTNSESSFQYYNVHRLAADIEWMVEQEITSLNVCSEPLAASEIHERLIGQRFSNTKPKVYREDIRSDHATRFGSKSPYLYNRETVVRELGSYFLRAVGQ